jgi:hypothetical protein
MRMFENRVLRKKLGFKRNEKKGEWRSLQKEKFYDLYLSNIFVIKSRIKTRAVHVEVWETGQVHKGWGDLREKKPLGRSRRRWKGNFKLDLQEVVGKDMDCIVLGQYMNIWPAVLIAALNYKFH